MKNSIARLIIGVLLLIGWVALAVGMIACSGGGDGPTTTTVAGADTGVTTGTLVPSGTTTSEGMSIDPLSSFQSKDPFIQQAQVTTTTAAPVTTVALVTTTTVRLTTTTTAPHRLQVTDIPLAGGVVSFTLDSASYTGFPAGPALFIGPWGSIQIISVNDSSEPYTATFRRTGYSPDIVLAINAYRTW